MLTFTSTSESTKCTEISTIQDHVIESDESFQVELSVVTVLPGSLKRNLIVGETSSTITIQDTSKPLPVGVKIDVLIHFLNLLRRYMY